MGMGSTSQVKCWQLKSLQIFLQTRNGLGYKAKDNLELEVCLDSPHMIATAKCKLPLDLCLENPEWLPLVGCSGEGYPRQVCLDFPNLITSPACQGQNCTFQACPPCLLLHSTFPSKYPTFTNTSHQLTTAFMEPSLWKLASDFPLFSQNLHVKVSLFLFAHYEVEGESFKLFFNNNLICQLSATAALDGYEATLFDCQDNKEFFCSRNMCDKHQFIVKC